MRSVRPGVHDAREGTARQHQPIVIDVGGLGQAGRARREDEERAVLDGERAALRFGQIVARQAVHLAVDARMVGLGAAVQPDLRLARDMEARRLECFEQFGGHHDVPRLDRIDAVRECGSGQIGIEQPHHAADPGDAEPDRHELRPVRHQEADRVALADALCEPPARIAVRTCRELPVAEALAVGEQRRRVAVFVGELGDDLREDTAGVACNRRRHAQRAQGTPQAGRVGLEPLDQSHGNSRQGRRRDSPPRCREASGSGPEVARWHLSGRGRRTGRAGCR